MDGRERPAERTQLVVRPREMGRVADERSDIETHGLGHARHLDRYPAGYEGIDGGAPAFQVRHDRGFQRGVPPSRREPQKPLAVGSAQPVATGRPGCAGQRANPHLIAVARHEVRGEPLQERGAHGRVDGCAKAERPGTVAVLPGELGRSCGTVLNHRRRACPI